MADPELFWMFKSFLELLLEPNCGKVRLVIFWSCLCFAKCPYPTELSLIFPWLVLSDSGLFSLIKFTANPQSFAVSVDTKMKVIWAWKEVLKEEALKSFICHYSLTHSLTDLFNLRIFMKAYSHTQHCTSVALTIRSYLGWMYKCQKVTIYFFFFY